jgi:benzoyl-CoA reductase/2-hydroxyglutaryl-CoA dehydratase subunit BcrC/BadD/HgdB
MAGGLLPVRMEGGEGLPSYQDPRIYQLMCPYLRTIFNRAVREDRFSMEAVVLTNGCDALKRLYDLWKAFIPTRGIFSIEVPKIQTDEAISFYEHELRMWAEEIETSMKCRITEEGLRDSIAKMNELRREFDKIVNMRKENHGLITFEQMNRLSRRILSSGPYEGITILKNFQDEISRAGSRDMRDTTPVFLISTMIDQPRIIQMIEDAGLYIVSDDTCTGIRHFEGIVSESGDPYRALAERYLRKWPCARMKGTDERFRWIDRQMDQREIRGVIFLWLKYCDQSGFEIPLLKRHLEKRGIPLLILENDYTEGPVGQLKVRIEAFAEVLRGEF